MLLILRSYFKSKSMRLYELWPVMWKTSSQSLPWQFNVLITCRSSHLGIRLDIRSPHSPVIHHIWTELYMYVSFEHVGYLVARWATSHQWLIGPDSLLSQWISRSIRSPRQLDLNVWRGGRVCKVQCLNLTRVTSPPNSTIGGSRLIFSVPFSYISFSSFTFPGAPYRIFLPFLPWLTCHFYLVI